MYQYKILNYYFYLYVRIMSDKKTDPSYLWLRMDYHNPNLITYGLGTILL